MRLTDFFLGVVVGIGAALLYRRCPPTSAAARPDTRTISPEPSIWSGKEKTA